MAYTHDFHFNLASRRKELHLTQEQVAQRMNVSAQAVSKWEKTSFPDAELLPRLAAVLSVSLDELFGRPVQGANVDPAEVIWQAVHELPPQKRPKLIAKLYYAIICAYQPSTDCADLQLRSNYERETFAHLHTDDEVALARLNPDFRYFLYLEKPDAGIASYLQDHTRMVLLLKTLADADALRIIDYLAQNSRNKLFMTKQLAEKLTIPEETVQRVINRLDRFGLVWRMSADLDEPTILYGFSHNPALVGLLVMAQSVCNYLQVCDPQVLSYTIGILQDKTSGANTRIPQVSSWDADVL